MLILFDFENIQNAHYQKVKRLLIAEFGRAEWAKATKYGAVAHSKSLPDWNSSMMIYTVPKGPQAADQKLMEIASRHVGNRCIVVSGDKKLCAKIHEIRRESREKRLQSKRASEKTKTFQVLFREGELSIEKI